MEQITLLNVADALGVEKANTVTALTIIVAALMKQPNIDGQKLIADMLENLMPAPGHPDRLSDFRQALKNLQA